MLPGLSGIESDRQQILIRGIVLLTEMLGREDMWELLASVDVYVSLHRAEGLGLGMMEAMSVGTPVIATAWSGNLDFMDDEDSILVPYDMKPATGLSHIEYRDFRHIQWAEPDVEEAAEALRALAASSDLTRQRLGRAAASRVRTISESRRASGLLQHVVEGAPAVVQGDEHIRRCRQAYATARRTFPGYNPKTPLLERGKRAGVRVMRQVGLMPPGARSWPTTADCLAVLTLE